MPSEAWTAERVDLLKRLWAEGETAAAIAELLGGMSRSAVLGKVFRLRLHADNAATAPQSEQKSAALMHGEQAERPARRRRSGQYKRRRSAPTTATGRTTLLDLTNNTCRWPHGRPGTERFFFCGAPGADLEQGVPYCARHMQRAYQSSVLMKEAEGMVAGGIGPSPRAPARFALRSILATSRNIAPPRQV